MQKIKRLYVKPILCAEQFLPNNYCNTCYKLKCWAAYPENESESDTMFDDVDYQKGTGNENTTVMLENGVAGMGHNPSYCGNSDHQAISVGANNAITVYELEIQSGEDNLTTLPCTLVSGTFGVGNVIKWTTNRNGKLYHHWGKCESTNATKPNMS